MTARAALQPDVIVAEAIALIRDGGVDALSMRALATRLSVTAPALYAHFDGRDALLRACAQVGYDQLGERFGAQDHADPIELVWASSRAYVRFARDEPALFSLMFMFRPDAIEIDAGPEVDPAEIEHVGATSMFDAMLANLARAVDEGLLRRREPLDYGLALWASVHGVATVAGMTPGLDAEALLESVVGGLLEGWQPA